MAFRFSVIRPSGFGLMDPPLLVFYLFGRSVINSVIYPSGFLFIWSSKFGLMYQLTFTLGCFYNFFYFILYLWWVKNWMKCNFNEKLNYGWRYQMLVSLQNSVKKFQNLIAFHANALPPLKQSNKHTHNILSRLKRGKELMLLIGTVNYF